METLSIVVGALLLLNYFRLCGRQRRPVKAMAINSLAGLLALCLLAAISGFLGNAVAVNPATVIVSMSLGIPGVIMLLLTLFVI